MKIDKSLTTGSTTMLILKLLESKDMYGYQMIEELEKKSNHIFSLKAGTLYPLLHSLEQKNMVESYDVIENTRQRKYYHITSKGKKLLKDKKEEWETFSSTVNQLLGGAIIVPIFS